MWSPLRPFRHILEANYFLHDTTELVASALTPPLSRGGANGNLYSRPVSFTGRLVDHHHIGTAPVPPYGHILCPQRRTSPADTIRLAINTIAAITFPVTVALGS